MPDFFCWVLVTCCPKQISSPGHVSFIFQQIFNCHYGPRAGITLSDAELAEHARDGAGLWVDHLLPAVQEAGDPAAAAAAKQEKLPTSSPQERADVAEMKGLVEDLWGPDGTGERSGAVHSAGLSHGNAKIAAGKA